MGRFGVVAVMGLVLLVACAGVPPSSAGPTIERIRANPGEHEDREVTLAASFKGWKGGCPGPPPVSRGDWMVDDGTGCLYVHGPLPPGVDPSKPKNEKVVATGILKRSAGGVPYLDVTAGKPAVPARR